MYGHVYSNPECINIFLKFYLVIAILNKHYSAVLKSIPLEFNTAEVKTMSHNQRVMTKFNSRIANEMMFNKLVNEVVSPDYDKTPVDFCRMLLMLIGDTPAVRALQKGIFIIAHVYVCMYVCMYVYVYTCMHACVSVCISVVSILV